MHRKKGLAAVCASVLALCTTGVQADKKYGPGVSDTEIKIGETFPYSGPASAYATIARAEAAYFQMVNDQGGINGRKIKFVSVDDAYSPPKTVEQTRRLVEDEEVLALFGSLGTPTNLAVRKYLNQRKVPQLFILSGAGIVKLRDRSAKQAGRAVRTPMSHKTPVSYEGMATELRAPVISDHDANRPVINVR